MVFLNGTVLSEIESDVWNGTSLEEESSIDFRPDEDVQEGVMEDSFTVTVEQIEEEKCMDVLEKRKEFETIGKTDDDQGTCKYAVMKKFSSCLLYTSPSPRDRTRSRMPSSA